MSTLHFNQKLAPPQPLCYPSQTPKAKPVLRKTITFKCKMPSGLAYISKCRPKMLSTVHLVNLESSKPNFKTLRTICQNLKNAKSGTSLILRANGSSSQNLTQLKHLLNRNHHRWKKLILYYIDYDEEHLLNQETAEILTRLRKYRDLLDLKAILRCTEDIKNSLLPCLLQQIKGLKNLRLLDLDLSECRDNFELIQEEDYEPNAPIFKFKPPTSLNIMRIAFQRSILPNSQLLNQFASNLSNCNLLRCLNLNCRKISSSYQFSAFARMLEKKQSIPNVRITKEFSRLEHLQESQIFAQSIAYLKHLTLLNLVIYFDLPKDHSKVFIKNLFQRISTLQNLKLFWLDLHVQEYPADQDYQNFLLSLQSLTSLQVLILDLHGKADQGTTHLQTLPQAFQSLSSLADLKISLPDHKISHMDIISLSHIFKNLPCLRKLTLILNEIGLEYDSLEVLYTRIAQLNLTSFVFKIQQSTLDILQENKTLNWKDEKGLTSLFSTLYDFTSLSTLDLCLSSFDISSKELKNLSLALRGMSKLSSLFLELPRFDPDRRFQGLRSLLSSIKELPKIATFKLICKGEELCDEEVELIVSNIGEEWKYLETLGLSFPESQHLGKRSLLAIKNGIRNLLSLKNLTLVFGLKSNFNWEIFLQLLEALCFLKNLEVIKIDSSDQSVPENLNDLLRRMGGHLNLKTFVVNKRSLLKIMNQNGQ